MALSLVNRLRYIYLSLQIAFWRVFRLFKGASVKTTTVYFDRNVFDQIDRNLDVSGNDLALIRREVAKGKIAVLVSFETVVETANARFDTALKGLKLIKSLCRQELPIKPHVELVRDDISDFAAGRRPSAPFVNGRFSIDSVIADFQNPEFMEMIADEKRRKEKLNEDLKKHVDYERHALKGKRPANFQKYWEQRSGFYAESFAHFGGCLEQCKAQGIDNLLQVRSIRTAVGALLSLMYSLWIEGRAVNNGTAYDLKHAAPMSAADIVITNDGELRNLLRRQPAPDLRVMKLPEFVEMIASK